MFKDRLVELRKLNNDTQVGLAKRLNVSRSLVAKWEQGRAYPNEEDLEQILILYNIQIEELISPKELKLAYGKSLKNNKLKNIIIFILLIVATTSLVLSIVFGLKKNNTTYIGGINVKEEFLLRKYTDINGNVQPLVLNVEPRLSFNNEYGYAYESLTINKIKYTDKSSLYFIYYRLDITSGRIAFFNDHLDFNKDSRLSDVSIKERLNIDKNINPIIAYPDKFPKQLKIQSRYSDNLILNDKIVLNDVCVENNNLYYDGNIMHLIMTPDREYQEAKLKMKNISYYASELKYEVIRERAKDRTRAIYFCNVLEINDSKSDYFTINYDINVTFYVDNKNYCVESNKEFKFMF